MRERFTIWMPGERCRGKEKKAVTLTFDRERLVYDIRNMAFVESDKLGEDAEHAKHLIADIGEDGNEDRMARVLALTHAAAIEMLYPFTKEPVEDEDIDNHECVPEAYVINLEVPVTMSRTTMHYVARLIHEWMVDMVLVDWLTVLNPNAAEAWMMKAQQAKDAVHSALSRRLGVIRRTLSPF